MQETDQIHGIFKSHFFKNLELITQHQLEDNKSVSINPSLAGFLVFGGEYPETKHTDYINYFEIAFRKEKYLEAWAKVGTAPLTHYCLASHKVCHEGSVVGDTFEKNIQEHAREERHVLHVVGSQRMQIRIVENKGTRKEEAGVISNGTSYKRKC